MVLDLALPSARGKATSATAKLTSSAAAIVHSEPRKPRASRRKLPRKKPAPFSAFFEPVRIATHLNSDDSASAGTSTLMALLALILVRSLATPDMACAAMTYATETGRDQVGPRSDSIVSATTCRSRPSSSVARRPRCAAIQPPTRLVTTPNSS